MGIRDEQDRLGAGDYAGILERVGRELQRQADGAIAGFTLHVTSHGWRISLRPVRKPRCSRSPGDRRPSQRAIIHDKQP